MAIDAAARWRDSWNMAAHTGARVNDRGIRHWGGFVLGATLAMAPACRDGGEPSDDGAQDEGADDEGDSDDGSGDGASDGSGDGEPAGVQPVYLTPAEHLVRISMALRGT